LTALARISSFFSKVWKVVGKSSSTSMVLYFEAAAAAGLVLEPIECDASRLGDIREDGIDFCRNVVDDTILTINIQAPSQTLLVISILNEQNNEIFVIEPLTIDR
jgi:hypothetical protein